MQKLITHKIDGSATVFALRRSTEDDALKIREWLEEEDRTGVAGNFLCNWELTEKCHRDGTLLVLAEKLGQTCVAYQWGQLLHSGILQVRSAWRGKGLGRILVKYCEELALEQDEMVLRVECEPSTSIPFWEAMGFMVNQGDRSNSCGYKVLSKGLSLPVPGAPVSVEINLFPEAHKWDKSVPAIASFRPKASATPDGHVHLAQRGARGQVLHYNIPYVEPLQSRY